jgi:hypothetical protein
MTGGCHTTLECSKFKNGCMKCPKVKPFFRASVRKNSSAIQKLFNSKMSNVQIIAPSKFMVMEAAKSYSLKNQIVQFVPNRITSDLLEGSTKSSIPKNIEYFKIGIASAKIGDRLKGRDLIHELCGLIDKNKLELELLYLKDFKATEQFLFWNQIDCLLVPSRGDNSPNVIHEAKCFDIPVIATNVGGIPELLNSSFDVLLDAKISSAQVVLKAILQLKNRNFSSKAILQMREQFDLYSLNTIPNLIEIYKKLSNST